MCLGLSELSIGRRPSIYGERPTEGQKGSALLAGPPAVYRVTRPSLAGGGTILLSKQGTDQEGIMRLSFCSLTTIVDITIERARSSR